MAIPYRQDPLAKLISPSPVRRSKRVEGACTAGYCSASDCAADTLPLFGSSDIVEVTQAKRGEEERKVEDVLEGRNGKNEDGRDGIEA